MRGSRCSVLSGSVIEDILQGLLVDIAVELCEIRRQLDVLRASFDTVLAVAATRDAALLHQCVQALRSVELSERMEVEENSEIACRVFCYAFSSCFFSIGIFRFSCTC